MDDLKTPKKSNLVTSNSHFFLPPIGRSIAWELSRNSMINENISPLSHHQNQGAFSNLKSLSKIKSRK